MGGRTVIIGSAVIDMRIVGVQSLKQKRSILLSVIKRTHNKFNAAIAEVGNQDLWQSSKIGIAVISSSSNHVDQQLQAIIRFIESEPRIEVTTYDLEIL